MYMKQIVIPRLHNQLKMSKFKVKVTRTKRLARKRESKGKTKRRKKRIKMKVHLPIQLHYKLMQIKQLRKLKIQPKKRGMTQTMSQMKKIIVNLYKKLKTKLAHKIVNQIDQMQMSILMMSIGKKNSMLQIKLKMSITKI